MLVESMLSREMWCRYPLKKTRWSQAKLIENGGQEGDVLIRSCWNIILGDKLEQK